VTIRTYRLPLSVSFSPQQRRIVWKDGLYLKSWRFLGGGSTVPVNAWAVGRGMALGAIGDADADNCISLKGGCLPASSP
jgi:hypothetical protein